MKKRCFSLLLALLMILTLVPLEAFAVTGNELAADGSYSGTGSSVGTITVTVSGGKITNVTCSKASKSSYQTLVDKWLSKIKNQDATYAAIDAISAATSGKYGSGLKAGTLAALKTAPAASGSGVTNYTVTFNMNGHGSQIASQTVPSGSTATKPANPTAAGYVFDGWYSNSSLTTAYNFSAAVTKNLTLYAKWTENEGAGDSGIDLGTILPDGLYSCDTVKTEHYDYYVSVTMTVQNGKIVSITAEAEGQSKKNAKRLKTAVEEIREQLLNKDATINNLSAVDSVSGATYSANTIRDSLIIAANNGTEDSAGVGADTFNRTARDGTYKNSSATTYEEVYNPYVEVTVTNGVIDASEGMEAYAPGIRPYSASLLKEAAAYIWSQIKGKPATQATIAAVDVNAVSGATHSMKALTEELYAAFGGAPEEQFTESGANTGYTIYNPPAEVSDNGLTLQKTLTRNENGTYTVTITGYATKAASALGLYKQENKTVYSKADLDTGLYYYWYRGQAYQVHWDTYRNTDDGGKTYYYAYFMKNGVRMYMHQKGANTIMRDNDGVLKIGDSDPSEVYKAGQMPLYTKTTDYDHAGVYDSSAYTAEPAGTAYSARKIESGEYYIQYGGSYYKMKVKESSGRYYLRTEEINGKKYYLTANGGLTTSKDSAAYSKSETGTIYTSVSTRLIYTGGGSSGSVTVVAAYDGDANGLAITDEAVLIDEVNLNAFDVTSAKYAVYSRDASVSGGRVVVSSSGTTLKSSAAMPYTSELQSDGVTVRSSAISYSGFDYSSNYVASGRSGRALVVEITGLRLAEGAAGRDLSSNIGNAEIYVTADAKYPEVAQVSPLFDVLQEFDGVSSATHHLTYDLNGGHPEEDYPESNELYAGTRVYIVDEAPEKENAEFTGWSPDPDVTFKTDENGSNYFIMPKTDVTMTAQWKSTVIEPPAAEGVYGDYSTTVSDGTSKINYDLIARIIVDADGKITDVLLDSERATTQNRRYLSAAQNTIRDAIIGESATTATLDLISEASGCEVDGVTHATVSRAAGKAALLEALQHLRAPYTVTWEFDNGTADKVDANVLYATRTAALQPADPTKTGSGMTYTFDSWTPDVRFFVTDDASYRATYTSEQNTCNITWVLSDGSEEHTTVTCGEIPRHDDVTKTDPTNEYTYTFTGWADENGDAPKPATGDVTYTAQFSSEKTGYQIHLQDYTKAKATASLVPGAFYTAGSTVTFTVKASSAVVLAVQDSDGAYTRMYCTEDANGDHVFTVDVADADVYLVMAFKGDVNLDGRVNLRDSSYVNDAYVGLRAVNALQTLVGNVNVDRRLNLRDSSAINDNYVGLTRLAWDLQTA